MIRFVVFALMLAGRALAEGPTNPTTLIDLQNGYAVNKYPYSLLYGRTSATGSTVIPISIDSTGKINVNTIASVASIGSATVYYPSGYTMPQTNSRGSTVYPSSGAVWSVAVSAQGATVYPSSGALFNVALNAVGATVYPSSGSSWNVNLSAVGATVYPSSGALFPVAVSAVGATVYPSSGAVWRTGADYTNSASATFLNANAGTVFTGSDSVKHNAPYELAVGNSASTSIMTYSVTVGASGGATITLEAGIQNVFAKMDRAEQGVTDWVGSSFVSVAQAATGSYGKIFNDAFYPIALDANGVTRTLYLSSASGRTIIVTIWKTLY